MAESALGRESVCVGRKEEISCVLSVCACMLECLNVRACAHVRACVRARVCVLACEWRDKLMF